LRGYVEWPIAPRHYLVHPTLFPRICLGCVRPSGVGRPVFGKAPVIYFGPRKYVKLNPKKLAASLRQIDRATRIVDCWEPLSDAQARRVAAYLQECPRAELWVGSSIWEPFDARLLRHFAGLRKLRLHDSQVQHCEAVAELGRSLRRLDIGGSRPQEELLGILPSLPQLTHLCVEGPSRDADPIGSLPMLRYLYLRSFTLPDVSFMLPLRKLEWVWIGLGGIKDLSLLPRVGRIRYLELWKINGLTDLSWLSDMTALEEFKLDSLRRVAALPDLSRLHSLRRVVLFNMKGLRSLKPLCTAPALESLIVNNSRHMLPRDFRPLRGHPSLRRLLVHLGSRSKNEEVKRILPLPEASGTSRRDLMWRA
jgi:hypothetical protein